MLVGFSKTCESDCEAIENRFTNGLVTEFLFEWSPNVTRSGACVLHPHGWKFNRIPGNKN